tara:strand:- start:92 stop:349 length:258 start_codon:yes stop_codon:yes gene_type:complete
MKEALVSEEELQRAKNKMRSSFYSAIEDSYSIAYWGIKEKLFNKPSISEYIDGLESVTREGVREASRGMYDKNKRLTMICGGKEN